MSLKKSASDYLFFSGEREKREKLERGNSRKKNNQNKFFRLLHWLIEKRQVLSQFVKVEAKRMRKFEDYEEIYAIGRVICIIIDKLVTPAPEGCYTRKSFNKNPST